MTKEEYDNKYFNKVETLTAVCRTNSSWARGEYPELEVGTERVKYKLFRLEDENISPSWSGDAPVDSIKDYYLPISEQTYQEVLQVYQNYVDNLRIVLFKNKDIQNLKMDL